MIAAAAALLLTFPPLLADPPAEQLLDRMPYCTWRTRFVLDGHEIDAGQLNAETMELTELHVEGRRVRIAWFTLRQGGSK